MLSKTESERAPPDKLKCICIIKSTNIYANIFSSLIEFKKIPLFKHIIINGSKKKFEPAPGRVNSKKSTIREKIK
ncbi:MAG: hypothetical protein OH319_00295 [Candidatus Parvarchaeota archaeon]|nr:hypothetical protein [Candidatus Jingweiarchaeum tengchongense]MCW1298416.1 hypothetical protein [Candidatus Jingweiarchaeum tengchongense]MCW1310826.1 hypothetical protein [Candidatus Jingweiarchaeum tengchongense]